MQKLDYTVVIEQAGDGSYSAYVPDLPGCVACGDTVEEAAEAIREAVRLHIESLRRHGEQVPAPVTRSIKVSAA